jgi:hypothetical protein
MLFFAPLGLILTAARLAGLPLARSGPYFE